MYSKTTKSLLILAIQNLNILQQVLSKTFIFMILIHGTDCYINHIHTIHKQIFFVIPVYVIIVRFARSSNNFKCFISNGVLKLDNELHWYIPLFRVELCTLFAKQPTNETIQVGTWVLSEIPSYCVHSKENDKINIKIKILMLRIWKRWEPKLFTNSNDKNIKGCIYKIK